MSSPAQKPPSPSPGAEGAPVNTAGAPADLALPTRLLITVFLPFAGGFFLSFLFRSVNALIAKDLAGEFGLSPADIGLLTSTYLLAFAAMQVPVGVLLDRYGPRRVVAALLCFAGIGALMFGLAQGLWTLTLGRALIGFGVSACLMGSMKAYSMWFPLERIATLNGWTIAAGGIGALAATTPMEALLGPFGWRAVFIGLALCCWGTAFAIFSVVPEKPLPGRAERWGEAFGRVLTVMRSHAFWRLGSALWLSHAVYQVMFGLWIAPWLVDVGGLTRADAAAHMFAATLAYTLGSVFFGWLSDWLGDHGYSRMGVYKAGAGVVALAFAGIAFDVCAGMPQLRMPLLVIYALGAISGSLAYSLITISFPPDMTGRVTTAVNVAMFSVSFACQFGIGVALQAFPSTGGRYAPEGYMTVFGVLTLAQAAVFLWLLSARDQPRLPPRSSP